MDYLNCIEAHPLYNMGFIILHLTFSGSSHPIKADDRELLVHWTLTKHTGVLKHVPEYFGA